MSTSTGPARTYSRQRRGGQAGGVAGTAIPDAAAHRLRAAVLPRRAAGRRRRSSLGVWGFRQRPGPAEPFPSGETCRPAGGDDGGGEPGRQRVPFMVEQPLTLLRIEFTQPPSFSRHGRTVALRQRRGRSVSRRVRSPVRSGGLPAVHPGRKGRGPVTIRSSGHRPLNTCRTTSFAWRGGAPGRRPARRLRPRGGRRDAIVPTGRARAGGEPAARRRGQQGRARAQAAASSVPRLSSWGGGAGWLPGFASIFAEKKHATRRCEWCREDRQQLVTGSTRGCGLGDAGHRVRIPSAGSGPCVGPVRVGWLRAPRRRSGGRADRLPASPGARRPRLRPHRSTGGRLAQVTDDDAVFGGGPPRAANTVDSGVGTAPSACLHRSSAGAGACPGGAHHPARSYACCESATSPRWMTDHSRRARRGSQSVRPASVNAYSTRTGTSGYTVRVTRPSR